MDMELSKKCEGPISFTSCSLFLLQPAEQAHFRPFLDSGERNCKTQSEKSFSLPAELPPVTKASNSPIGPFSVLLALSLLSQ